MKQALLCFLLVVSIALPCSAQSLPSSGYVCPVTLGSASLGPPFPPSENWYGSESLAVLLPENGQWNVTAPGARIAVKLFVWSQGFEPGMESNLSVDVVSLTGGANDAVIKDITGADAESLGGWTMLAGIDFPSPGCWRLTLEFLGQSLAFIVETVDRSGQVASAGDLSAQVGG